MIIVMKRGATEQNIDEIVSRIEKLGYRAHLSRGVERTIIGVIGRQDKSPIRHSPRSKRSNRSSRY